MDAENSPGNETGATLVEHAIVLPIILILLLVSFETFRLGYCVLTAQFVATRVGRETVLGDITTLNTIQQTAYLDRLSFVHGQIKKLAKSFGVTIADADIMVCRDIDWDAATKTCPLETAGEPGGFFVVQIRFAPKFLFIRQYVIGATVLARNEFYT